MYFFILWHVEYKKNTGYSFGPPLACRELESYIDKTKLKLSQMDTVSLRPFISKTEKETILYLKNNNYLVNIVIWTEHAHSAK